MSDISEKLTAIWKNPDAFPTLCWCLEAAVHETWCWEHVPRCRSGAHFHGNCKCVGEQELARRSRKDVS